METIAVTQMQTKSDPINISEALLPPIIDSIIQAAHAASASSHQCRRTRFNSMVSIMRRS
jgi:hypothetical protein